MTRTMSRALFLDRDGTVIVHRPYLHQPADVELMPGAAAALGRARAEAWKIFLFTNQSGVGRGLFSLADAEAVNQRMIELLGLGHDLFDGSCIAPEAPDQPSLYRKPSPRFIVESLQSHRLSAENCWIIGDTPTDWGAGMAAGIRACAVRSDLTTLETERVRHSLGVPLFANLDLAFSYIQTQLVS